MLCFYKPAILTYCSFYSVGSHIGVEPTVSLKKFHFNKKKIRINRYIVPYDFYMFEQNAFSEAHLKC